MSKSPARRATIVSVALITVYALSAQIFPSVLPEFTPDNASQGLLLMAMYLLYPIASTLSGAVADRCGKPSVLFVGTLLLALPFFAASFSESFAVVMLATLLHGCGGGIVESQGTAMLCDVNPGRERMAVNLSQAFFCAGAMTGPLAVATAFRMFPEMRLQTVFLAAGCLCAVSIPASLLIRRVPAHAGAPGGGGKVALSRDLLVFCLVIFLHVLLESGLAGWLAIYGAETFSLSLAEAPVILTCFWCCIGVTRLVTAFVRIPLSNRALILVALSSALILFAAMLAAPDARLFYAALIPLALTAAVVWPAIVAMAGARFPGASGMAVGVVVGCGAVASALVQLAVGWLAGPLGLRGALACLALPVALDIVVVLLWLPRGEETRG